MIESVRFTALIPISGIIRAVYYIEFISDKGQLATGRTSDHKLALNAIKDWITGRALPELYTAYEFVDQHKRNDKRLRAGTSLYSLVLSKSRRHGLRKEQSCIRFSFADEGIYIDSDPDKRTFSEGFALTEDISHLLESLNNEQIS